jgi:hypothetical protein
MVIESRLRDAVYGAGGLLLGGTLVEDFVIDGVPCQGGEIVELHEDGRLKCAKLASDAVVAGVPCAGDADVEFYPSGPLRWARLARPHLIGPVPCAAGSGVSFHPTGALWNGSLGDRWRRDGRDYQAGTILTLDPAGHVLEWSSDVPPGGVVDGLPCREDAGVWRYPSGRLSNVVLAGPAVIDGVAYEVGTEIDLDQEGHVVSAVVTHFEEGVRYKRRTYGQFMPR